MKKNSIKSLFPNLVSEWHPEKNRDLLPSKFTKGSDKKIWWLCPSGHEYECAIHYRTSGRGCPYCSRKKPSPEYCLETISPLLAKEWHPTKNYPLTPKDVAKGSGRKVWWICSAGHEYESTVRRRVKNIKSCLYCSSLAHLYPEIAKEWHQCRNGDLTPLDVTPGLGKKVFWICSASHEYESAINKRTHGRACPYCSGQKVCFETSLKSTHPELCKQWDSSNNVNLTPEQVSKGSDKKVFWICDGFVE